MSIPLVTVITCTGGRFDAFAQCERYMTRQTYQGPIQWLIIDDCEPSTSITLPFGQHKRDSWIRQEYYKGPKTWKPGQNTQRLNMDEALKHVQGDYIFCWEDDDWYSPQYIEAYVNLLQHYPAVGEGNAKYYNISERSYRDWSNYQHASLCQTAIRKEMMPILDDAVNSGVLFMDIQLWQYLLQRTKPLMIVHQDYVIGMKGLPGRFGIGAGHAPQDQGFKKDPFLDVLKAWVGPDWTWYQEQVAKMTLANTNQKG